MNDKDNEIDLYMKPRKGQIFNLDITDNTGFYMFIIEYISESNVYGNEKAIYEPLYNFNIAISKEKFNELVSNRKILS